MRSLRSRPGLILPMLLTALAMVAISLAGIPAGAQNASDLASGSGYTVRGTVVNSVTGQPIARALVTLGQDPAMLSGADGGFSFEHVPAGNVQVHARRPGYMGGLRRGLGSGFAIDDGDPARNVVVGPEMPDLILRLVPEAVISGQVTLSTTDPAGGIQVLVYRRHLESGRLLWSQAGFAITRSDGTFRTADLSPGSYIVEVQSTLDHPGARLDGASTVWGFHAVYYPGVTDPAAAGVLTLDAGQHAEADLTLTLQRFFPVTVGVSSSQPGAAINFEILDAGGRATAMAEQFDARQQVLHAAVPSGSWTLMADAFGSQQSWGQLDFQVNGAPVRAAIGIVPVPRIPVTIRRDYTAPDKGPWYAGPGFSLALISVNGNEATGGYLREDRPGSGSWSLDLNRPGSYWVETNAPAPVYVSEISSGGTDLATEPLVILPGSPVAPIELTLRNDAGGITGRVRSAGTGNMRAGEQPRIWVYAIPLFPSTGNLPSVVASPSGQFSLSSLAPGAYRVIACDQEQEIDFRTPQGLAAWAGKGNTVTVDAGSTASVDLDLSTGEAAR